MPEISIIIVTYNSDWYKLRATINSVLMQKGVDYEVVFADDGSKKKWNEEIVQYIQNRCKFTFSDLKINIGTVSNILGAIQKAQGRYVKVISPGDCFYSDDSVRCWIQFMKSNKAEVSFCNAAYYRCRDGKIEIVKEKNSPKNIYIYHQRNNERKLFVDYMLANDFILGASILAEKKLMCSYLMEMQGKVKYAEDYMIRLMIFDGKKINHVNNCFIWYEYGDGISTKENSKWEKMLKKDFEATNNIIKDRPISNRKIQKKYKNYLVENNEKLKKIVKVTLFPTMIIYRIKMKYTHERTFLADAEKLKSVYLIEKDKVNNIMKVNDRE